MRYLFFILVIVLFASCRTPRNKVNSAPAQVVSRDSIVFITMKMWHDSLQGNNAVEVLEIITSPGTLKRPMTDSGSHDHYLKCLLLSHAGVRDSFLVEHPLYREVEVMGEDNHLSMHRLNLKETQFFVRFQKKNYHSLVIKEQAVLKPARDRQVKVISF